MSKRLISVVLSALMLITSMTFTACADASPMKSAEAAYGTPTIDGKVDEVWETTNYYIVDNSVSLGKKEYKGWFKVLWDEENLYVLVKCYNNNFTDRAFGWEEDRFEVFIDEDFKREERFDTDDYQVCVNYDGLVVGSNYNGKLVNAASDKFDNAFLIECAFPLKTTTIKENMNMGFEVSMITAPTLGMERRTSNWNTEKNWIWNSPTCYGKINLKKSVAVDKFEEPEFKGTEVSGTYVEKEVPTVYEMVNGVNVNFDSSNYVYPVLLSNEYPCMEINQLAASIGGSVENGDTLVKGDTKVKFIEGSRLAEFGNGHLMIERAPSMHDGKLYVPVSVLETSLCYTVFYDRFNKFLEIKTGTDYPQEPEVTFYAKDFGAVGDGVHYDGAAIRAALNAAIMSGVPSRVELEPGKTYRLEERIDNVSYFLIYDTNNLTFDGMGSTLLFERPTNGFVDMYNCANVKIKNIDVKYEEPTHTQGTVTEVNYNSGTFKMEIQEGFPVPAADEWTKNVTRFHDASKGWWYGQFMDPVEDRLKFTKYDNYGITAIHKVQGREYELSVGADRIAGLPYIDVGDRFVIETRHSAYAEPRHFYAEGATHGVQIMGSGDITFENFYLYGTIYLGYNVGLNWGKINLFNAGLKTPEGRLFCTGSDGIHNWRNRAGLILDGAVLQHTLDDQINTKGEDAIPLKKIDDYTYEVDYDLNYRVGDELVFYDKVNFVELDRAYLKDFNQVEANKTIITIDRKIDGIITQSDNKGTPTVMWNVNSSARGSVIKNSRFDYSRRFTWIVRSQNSLFDNNIQNNCGAGVQVANENFSWANEGPFPSSFTIRNCHIYGDDMDHGLKPIDVQTWHTSIGDEAMIDGVLMEGNLIDVPTNIFINVKSAKNLYMLNNTFKCDKPLPKNTTPVTITNSHIAKIDGLTFDCPNADSVRAVVNITACKFNESDIKNINVVSKNAEPLFVQ